MTGLWMAKRTKSNDWSKSKKLNAGDLSTAWRDETRDSVEMTNRKRGRRGMGTRRTTMHWKPREWTLIGMLLALPGAMTAMKVAAAAQATSGNAIATTQVTDTVYRADGTPATGTVTGN